MTAGETVNIYQDPITGKEFEGRARLVEQTHKDTGDGLGIWRVVFLSEPGNIYLRTVNAANANIVSAFCPAT